MTVHDLDDCAFCALAADIWERGLRGELPTPAWNEGDEQRASQIAETWDDDTHTYRPLGPRKDRP